MNDDKMLKTAVIIPMLLTSDERKMPFVFCTTEYLTSHRFLIFCHFPPSALLKVPCGEFTFWQQPQHTL
jgi:hypothetical protein